RSRSTISVFRFALQRSGSSPEPFNCRSVNTPPISSGPPLLPQSGVQGNRVLYTRTRGTTAAQPCPQGRRRVSPTPSRTDHCVECRCLERMGSAHTCAERLPPPAGYNCNLPLLSPSRGPPPHGPAPHGSAPCITV